MGRAQLGAVKKGEVLRDEGGSHRRAEKGPDSARDEARSRAARAGARAGDVLFEFGAEADELKPPALPEQMELDGIAAVEVVDLVGFSRWKAEKPSGPSARR